MKENLTVEEQKRHGIFIGTVMQHLAHGKLKVYIHGIYPIEFYNDPSKLPTCLQMVSQFGGSHDGNGIFSYPNIGATVLCTFANGDQNLPIMLGVVQGGENAFGQYELVKNASEISSTRHLVTSGKSHIELYEDGKISAVVVDPIRTEAKVKYDESINGQLSIDAVESRPICEKVDSEELSSINCQFVLDNAASHGTISSSTHWYSPLNESITTSADGETITNSQNGEERNDYSYVAGNNGMVDCKQIHSAKKTTTFNKISPNRMLQSIHPLTSDASVTHHHGIDGNDYTEIISTIVDSYNYTQQDPSANAISASNTTGQYSSYIGQSLPLDFQMLSEQSYKTVQTSQSNDGKKSLKIKSKASNDFHASKDAEIMLESLSSSNLQEVNDSLNMIHSNKHNSVAYLKLNNDKGFILESLVNDNDTQNSNNMSIMIKKNNEASIDAQIDRKVCLKMVSHKKVQQTINGTTDKVDIECTNFMLPSDKKIEIKIIDNNTKKSCSIILGADGVASLSATDKIDISAPTINISGQTMTQKFKTLSLNAQTMNIVGSQGDCKIKNVSLLNHKHMETQSGDVVSPQPSKTASQSN